MAWADHTSNPGWHEMIDRSLCATACSLASPLDTNSIWDDQTILGAHARYPKTDVAPSAAPGGRVYFCMPPETEISSPVTNDDASLAR